MCIKIKLDKCFPVVKCLLLLQPMITIWILEIKCVNLFTNQRLAHSKTTRPIVIIFLHKLEHWNCIASSFRLSIGINLKQEIELNPSEWLPTYSTHTYNVQACWNIHRIGNELQWQVPAEFLPVFLTFCWNETFLKQTSAHRIEHGLDF